MNPNLYEEDLVVKTLSIFSELFRVIWGNPMPASNKRNRENSFRGPLLPWNLTLLQIFEEVGTAVIDQAFAGYNATVFAYGQVNNMSYCK